MIPRVGVMLGRLSPRPPDRLQVFPSDWRLEMETGARLGFGFLEWLLLETAAGENPLDGGEGRREMRRVARETGLRVESVCAARFLHEPLAGLPGTVAAAAEVGARRVIVPLLEDAHIRSPEREDRAIASLEACVEAADRLGVTLALEVDVPGEAFVRVLRRIGHPRVRACYDVGNATSLGLDAAMDVEAVLPALAEVHVKDRLVGGGSVPLRTGHADFPRFFRALEGGGYAGDLVLEHFFDRDPVGEAQSALDFVRRHLEHAAY